MNFGRRVTNHQSIQTHEGCLENFVSDNERDVLSRLNCISGNSGKYTYIFGVKEQIKVNLVNLLYFELIRKLIPVKKFASFDICSRVLPCGIKVCDLRRKKINISLFVDVVGVAYTSILKQGPHLSREKEGGGIED